MRFVTRPGTKWTRLVLLMARLSDSGTLNGIIFTCGFQDAGLGATGSLLLLLLNLLLKPTSYRRHKTTTLMTESWHNWVIVHEKVNDKVRSGL